MKEVDRLPAAQELDQLLAEADANASCGKMVDSTVQNLRGELETMADDLRKPLADDPFQSEPACANALELATQVGGKPAPATAKEEKTAAPGLGMVGPYELLELLGQGGMGAVYKALHPKLDKIVALKVLTTARIKNGEAINRFQREMKAVGKLDHPHLIRALDAGEADGAHYLVMEYVNGTDLAALIKDHSPLPIAEACELVIQAASGLQAAHSRGMVHRDIKPANLMLAQQEFGPPVVKVLDLGLALLADADPVEAGGLTSDGQIMGTIDYMAPEQANDSHSVDIRADIYSLGATLYALLTGGSLFQGKPNQSLMQKLTALATEPAPPIRERRADISKALAAVVHRMLAKKSQDRFATPADVIAALKPFAAGANLASLGSGTRSPASDGSTNVDSYGGTVMLESVQNIEPTIQMPSSKSSNSLSPGRPWKAIAGAAMAAVVLFAVVLLTLKTPKGEVIVEIPADLSAEVRKEIKISVTGDGAAEVASEANGWRIGIKEGKYSVELKGGGDQVQIDDQQVTVNRNKKAIVTITMKPTRAMAAKGTKPAGGANSDPDRRAAEWILSLNEGPSNMMIDIVGGQRTDVANRQLPAVPFRVQSFALGGLIVEKLGDRLADELATHISGIRPEVVWVSSSALTTAGFAKLVAMPEFSEVSNINLKCFDRDMDNGIFPLLATLPKLSTIHIVPEPHLTGAGIGELKACSKLREIDWQGGSPSSTALEELVQLPKLETLGFNTITCTERHMMAIAKLKLRQIGFHSCRVDDGMLKHLGRMETLETLGVTHNPITDQGLSELKQIKTLKSLHLQGTKVSATGVADLQKALPNCKIEWDAPVDPNRSATEWLRSIGSSGEIGVMIDGTFHWVRDNEPLPAQPFLVRKVALSGPGIEQLGDRLADEVANRMKGVRINLDVTVYSQTLTTAGFGKLIRLPEFAEAIGVQLDCSGLGDGIFQHLAQLPNMSRIELTASPTTGSPNLTGKGMSALKACPKLAEISWINGSPSAQGIEELSQVTQLNSLRFNSITGSEQQTIALAKLSLRDLKLHASKVDDAMVRHLAAMAKLETLDISHNPITDKGLAELKPIRTLTALKLQGTKVTAAGVTELQKALPNCKIEWDVPASSSNPANAPASAIAPFDAAQARKHQEAWAKHLGVPVEYTNSIGMKFVLIPPGEFEMGSTAAEIEAALKYLGPADPLWKSYVQMEAPKHKVILTQARYLGVNEVTQSEYERVMGKNPSNFAATGLGKELVAGIVTAHHPVEMVCWLDVVDFCAKLSEHERLKPFAVRSGDVDVITPENGNGYQVPTEAEWEFACRAGTTTKYWFGDNDEDLVRAGWVNANSGGRTHAVGGLKANPFGLFDVHGNVMEFVLDRLEQISYDEFRNRPAINPSSLPILGQRLCRGGPLGAPWECRSASRSVSDYTPGFRQPSIGFRVSLPVDAVKAAVINKTLQDERMSNDPDYQFALWLKSLTPPLQFDVMLADGNPRPQTIEPTQLLPLEPFRVNYLFLQGPVLDQPGEAFVDEFAKRVKGQRITGIQFNSPTLTSERVARFAKLPELSDVNTVAITGELVDDKVIEALAGLHKLIHADLRCPKLTGKGLRQLSELTGLSLHDAANVTAEGIEELAQLPKLYSLTIDGYFQKVQLTERHIDAVTKLKLTEFLTDAVGIDDALLTRLSKMETLKVLILNKSPITDTGLAELKKLKGLTNLSLVGTKVTAAGVADLQKALPNCKIEWDAPTQ